MLGSFYEKESDSSANFPKCIVKTKNVFIWNKSNMFIVLEAATVLIVMEISFNMAKIECEINHSNKQWCKEGLIQTQANNVSKHEITRAKFIGTQS